MDKDARLVQRALQRAQAREAGVRRCRPAPREARVAAAAAPVREEDSNGRGALPGTLPRNLRHLHQRKVVKKTRRDRECLVLHWLRGEGGG